MDLDNLSTEELLAMRAEALSPSVAASDPLDSLSTEDLLAMRQSATASAPQTRGALSALGQVGQGLTFGFYPQVEGGITALGSGLANVLGLGSGQSMGDVYASTRDATAAELAAYSDENFYSSLGLQVAGGAIPGIAGGVARGAFGAAQAAPGIISSLGKNVFGVGFTAAPTIKELVKMGAVQGGLQGIAAAKEGEGAYGGTVGAITGAIASPIIGKGLERGIGYVADKASESGLISRLASEIGAVGDLPPQGTAALGPEDLYLARQLRNVPLEKVGAAAEELGEAIDQGLPLFLPEAVDDAKVFRNAKFIANYDPSMGPARSSIDARTAQTAERASGFLSAISPEDSPFQGAINMRDAAKEIITKAEESRASLVAPLYSQAFANTPRVSDPALGELVSKDQYLQRAIKGIKGAAAWADTPEDSLALLARARYELDDQIQSEIKHGWTRKARDLMETRGRLNAILHNASPELAKADEAFAGASDGLEKLTSTFLKTLGDVTDDKIQNIDRIFSLPPERIKGLRETFEKSGKLDQWEDGIRAHLELAAEGTKEGRNFTTKLIGDSLGRNRLKAALGEKAEGVIGYLDLENRFAQGKNTYGAGSSTFGHFSEESDFTKTTSFLSKLTSGDLMGAVGSLLGGEMPEELAKEMAGIYFDPKKGLSSLQKVIPLLEKYARNKAAAGALGTAGARATSSQGVGAALTPIDRRGLTAQETFSVPPVSDSPLKPISADQSNLGSLMKSVYNMGDDMGGDMPLVEAVIWQESRGKSDAVSPKGAEGLMQIMPATAKEIAEELGVEKYDLKDPETNKTFGTHYLNKMLKMFDGDEALALAAYNAGPGAVRKWVDRWGPNWDTISTELKKRGWYDETVKYVPSILKRKQKIVEA